MRFILFYLAVEGMFHIIINILIIISGLYMCFLSPTVEGHDSSEDARACMELMIWKIKEDAKVKR